MNTDSIPRINGSMLGSYIDRNVLLIAELVSIENMKMKIKCCDGQIIVANLQEQITNHLATNTRIQLLAIPKSSKIVQCIDFIMLQDSDQTFDMQMYNEVVKVLAEQEDSNTYLVNNIEEHWGAENEREINLIDNPDQDLDKEGGMGAASQHMGSQNRVDQSFF